MTDVQHTVLDTVNAKNMEDWEENLYHLSVACLHAWRIYNDKSTD